MTGPTGNSTAFKIACGLEIDPVDQIVQLVVGSETPTILQISRGRIPSSSEFLQRALDPAWTSTRDDPFTLLLPEFTVDEVYLYIMWCHNRRIEIPLYYYNPNHTYEVRAAKAEKVYTTIANAYAFSIHLLDDVYGNDLVTHLAEATVASEYWGLSSTVLKVLYDNTNSGSAKARQLLADVVALVAYDDQRGSVGWESMIRGCSHEQLEDIMLAVVRHRGRNYRRPQYLPWVSDPAHYFERKGKQVGKNKETSEDRAHAERLEVVLLSAEEASRLTVRLKNTDAENVPALYIEEVRQGSFTAKSKAAIEPRFYRGREGSFL